MPSSSRSTSCSAAKRSQRNSPPSGRRSCSRLRPAPRAVCMKRSRTSARSLRASKGSSSCRWTGGSRSARSGAAFLRSRRPEPRKRRGRDPLAALLPTGGTTGVPKVVPLTHRNVVASATASMLALDVRRRKIGSSSCCRSSTLAPSLLPEPAGARRRRGHDPADRRGAPQSGGRRQLLRRILETGSAPRSAGTVPTGLAAVGGGSRGRLRPVARAPVRHRRVGLSARDRAPASCASGRATACARSTG